MSRVRSSWFVGALVVLCAPASAFPQHAAHEHGKAELNLAIEADRELVVELLVPADSVYGFEHAPTNAAEREQQAAAHRRLDEKIASALAFEEKLGCSFERDPSADAKEHSDHQDHDDHGDDHHADDHETGGHSDVLVQWSVTCKRSIAGSSATFRWQDLLSGIDEVTVLILSAERQDELRFKGGSGVLKF